MDTSHSPDPTPSAVPATVASTTVQVQRAGSAAPVAAVSSVDIGAAFNELLGPDFSRLTPAQVLALRLLLSGQSDATAARAVGKHPCTVGRWRTTHPVFRRWLSAWRQSQKTSIMDGLFDLTDTCLDNVRGEVIKGNPNLSFSVLKHLSKLDPNKAAPMPEPDLPPFPPHGYTQDRTPPASDARDEENDPDDEGFDERSEER